MHLFESGGGFTSDGWIYGTDVSNLVPYGNDNLIGTSGNDTFVMSSGDDTIAGGSGFDTLLVDRDLTGFGIGITYSIGGNFLASYYSQTAIQTALLSASTSYRLDLGNAGETTTTSIERLRSI